MELAIFDFTKIYKDFPRKLASAESPFYIYAGNENKTGSARSCLSKFDGDFGECPDNKENKRSVQSMFSAVDNIDIKYLDMSDIRGTSAYCDDIAAHEIKKRMSLNGISEKGIHLLDNGNHHYLSLFTASCINEEYELILFDNHPDMRKPAYGDILSCGGWVRELLLKNKLLKKVILTGADKGLFEEELTYLKDEEKERDMDICSKIEYFFDIADFKVDAGLPVYISIDKDVLKEAEVNTNWDQGSASSAELYAAIERIFSKRKVIGVDICGEADVSDEADIKKGLDIDLQLINNIYELQKNK